MGHLSKPIQFDEFFDVIERHLKDSNLSVSVPGLLRFQRLTADLVNRGPVVPGDARRDPRSPSFLSAARDERP
jgi:hypothetical protein